MSKASFLNYLLGFGGGIVGLKCASECADRTKLVMRSQVGASGAADARFLTTHGLSRPSDAINASQSDRISSSISLGSVTVCATASRSISE
jgi:hypothetical protein